METPLDNAVDGLREAAQAATVSQPVVRRRARFAQSTFTLLLITFFIFAVAAHFDNYFRWDLIISRAIQSITLPGFDLLMRIISMPGNNFIIAGVMVLGVSSVLYLIRYPIEARALLFSALGGQLLNILIKSIVGRPRPTDDLVRIIARELTLSFPSGHVMHYISFYGFIFFLAYSLLKRSIPRTILLVLTGGAVLLIGVSRVYLGAHWPSDVTAAYLGGGLWLTFMISRYRRWKALKTKS